MSLGKFLCGLAAMAAFLAAPALAVAEEPGFLHSKYPNRVHAVPATKHVFTVTGSNAECTTMDFDSTTKTGPTKELTVTPTFSGCTAFGFAATIATNGCTYQLGQPEGFEDEWEGAFAIKCPAGKAIVIKVDNVFAKCTVEIGEQTPTGAVAYENETFAAGFNLAFSFSNVKDKVATSSGLCVLTLGEHTNATYKGSSTAEALEGGLLAIG